MGFGIRGSGMGAKDVVVRVVCVTLGHVQHAQPAEYHSDVHSLNYGVLYT